MSSYMKPTAEKVTFTYENQVVASSQDSGCYTVTARIHQTPETGREDYRIQVDAVHHADHKCDAQVLYLTFNQDVTYVSSNGTPQISSGTTISIAYTYHNNEGDSIGLGDVVVTSAPGLAVISATMTDTPS